MTLEGCDRGSSPETGIGVSNVEVRVNQSVTCEISSSHGGEYEA
jgi:hypothetical protein